MKRRGLALGLLSVGGQVLFLRELVGSLNGDELFIGTALFGWLIAVACGAFIGGKTSRPAAKTLFIIGAIAVPIVIALVRLSPLAFTRVPGEIIPFVKAALLSIAAMAPVGIISGWLFSAIVREGEQSSEAIIVVYLFEGIGAFIAGVVITIFSSGLLSTLTSATVIGLTVIVIALWPSRRTGTIFAVIAGAVAVVLCLSFVPRCDRWLDAAKYAPYQMLESFDTPYGRQTLVARDSSVVLLTDNSIEAVYPDRETAEYQLLPPLLYHPEAKRVLYTGRTEFGVGQLADSFPGISFAALDRRAGLEKHLTAVLPSISHITRIDDDPMRYLSRTDPSTRYDIIILNAGEPDNYQTSRLYSEDFLNTVRLRLKDDGILYIPTRYDTDRYLGPEKTRVLTIISKTLGRVFPNIEVWPGSMTLFFASTSRGFDLPLDSLVARSGRFPVAPAYVNGDYLPDRMEPMKRQRLNSALKESSEINSLNKPILPHYQAGYRSLADSFDRKVLGGILQHPRWLMIVPIVILLFLASTLYGRRGVSRFPLFLFFVAGLVSMTSELISFYLFQSTAGSLYSEIAVLIGAFMLGLAIGTYYAHGVGRRPVEYMALGLMATALLLFVAAYRVPLHGLVLVFHSLFLFTLALATGTLFVGATNRYYPWSVYRDDNVNPGAGYGWELVGSAIGALVTTTLFLPTIGLAWLLWSLMIVVVLAIMGAVVLSWKARNR
jgi:predicted membrane-bound spermidine synthase